MSRTRFVLPLAALMFAGAALTARPVHAQRSAAPTPAAPDSISPRADAGRVEGSPTATVWLVEASDFQCPFCKEWHDSTYPTILKEYINTGKIRFAFLNYPLSMHEHSMQAAEAGMCAAAQGKFWPMHDALFTTQPQWDGPQDPAAFFQTLAARAGVNVAAWKHCVATHAARPIINADRDRLRNNGVNSTPTFFIGGQKIEGAAPTASFQKAIDDALAKAGKH
ncbi:MAG TPA: thioredoxin domain-containing protein [Gemmatimonadaceae bacterium]|nr:thioredoxin domain-containing protein [Gemmatimonadaceae bacterium]